MGTNNKDCALILPGAVAKGAYEAGVISVLAERGVPVVRMVAASSGSLNAIIFAAGIRAGRPVEACHDLTRAWKEHGGWFDSLHFNPLEWINRKGLSDQRALIELLRANVAPCTSKVKYPVDLRIVVAPLGGLDGCIGGIRATTFEGIMHFSGNDFDSQEGLERIFIAASAACAFPGLFTPVDVPNLGPCIDGSAVNNAPIRYAIRDNDIDSILVPVPFPAVLPSRASDRGISLIEHMAEILVNERLYRDLREVTERNLKLDQLSSLVKSGDLTRNQLDSMESILGWRKIEITDIRPSKMLEGNFFSGFFSRRLRAKYIEEGRKAAKNFSPSLFSRR